MSRKKVYVKAGVTSDIFNDMKQGDVSGYTTIGTVAVANEFGVRRRQIKNGPRAGQWLPAVPARSFIRFTAQKYQNVWTKYADKIRHAVVTGRMTVKRGLVMMGEIMVRGIEGRISTIRRPPNAPWTIEKKKSSKPLVDKNQLRSSIKYEVHT